MIKTNRLELLKFDLKYAADLFQVWSDFEVIKYTYMPLMNSIEECAKAMIHYVFEHYPQATIKADTVSINHASLSVLRKVGFEELDISENGFNRNDLNLDLVNFELTKKG